MLNNVLANSKCRAMIGARSEDIIVHHGSHNRQDDRPGTAIPAKGNDHLTRNLAGNDAWAKPKGQKSLQINHA